MKIDAGEVFLVYRLFTKRTSMYGHHILQQSMDQPDKAANPARGQLNRERSNIPSRVGATTPEQTRSTTTVVVQL